jgi:hypothetical protein
MYKLLSSIARPRNLLIAAAAFLAAFTIVQVLASRLARLPDLRFTYSPGQLIAALDLYGQAGRLAYLRLHIADMIFPLTYGALSVLTLIYFWAVRGGAAKTASVLAVIALIGTTMDCTENACIQMVSALFSQGRTAADIAASPPVAATLAGFATAAKTACDFISLLAILAGIVFAMARRGRPRAGAPRFNARPRNGGGRAPPER